MIRTAFKCSNLIIAFLATATVTFAAPTISSLSVPALQVGSKVTITVSGSELLPSPVLVSSTPIVTQKTLDGAADNSVQFEVVLAANASPGIHSLRVKNERGISNALAVSVDTLPTIPFAERIDSTPVALQGNLAGGAILRTSFTGSKDQSVVVEVEGQRLGSSIRPVLRLLDPTGRQIAFSAPTPALRGDARLTAVLPEGGEYKVEMHDVLYKGPSPGTYRLKIGSFQFVDLVYPMGVQQGQTTSLRFLSSSNDGNADANGTLVGQDGLNLPSESSLSGSRPLIHTSANPEYVETDADGIQDAGTAPLAINGILSARGEVDEFKVAVKPGSKLRLDAYSQRAGAPVDGIITVIAEKGQNLGTNDDRGGLPDPGLDVTIPGDATFITVRMEDRTKNGGPINVYRINIEDISAGSFALTAKADRLQIPAGGSQTIEIGVARQGYNGPIDLSVTGLPEAVSLSGSQIPAGDSNGVLTLTAPADCDVNSTFQIIGTSAAENTNVTAVALIGDNPQFRAQPWVRQRIGISATTHIPIQAQLAQATDQLNGFKGTFVPVAVKVSRTEGTAGKIRFTSRTSQAMPKKTVKQNNKDVQVDDPDRALRLAENSVIEANINEHTVNVWVPADLGVRNWSFVIVAELLSADEKSVVATASTTAFTLNPADALSMKLTSEATLEAKAGGGETGMLSGTITRSEGFTKPVQVTLRGLPGEYPAPVVEVPADQTEFKLEVRFPENAPPKKLENIQLVAQSDSDLKPEVKISSNITNVTINVVAGEKAEEKNE